MIVIGYIWGHYQRPDGSIQVEIKPKLQIPNFKAEWKVRVHPLQYVEVPCIINVRDHKVVGIMLELKDKSHPHTRFSPNIRHFGINNIQVIKSSL